MPLRPLIIIDGFEAGILQDQTIQARNGFSYCAGINTFFEPGILKVSQRLDAMDQAVSPNNITDVPRWIVKYTDYYALGNTGRIYKNIPPWTLVHTDVNSGIGQSMIVFSGKLYWMANTTMGKFDGTTWTDSFKIGFTSSYHPMVVFGDDLMIGNKRFIAKMTSGEVLTLDALDLPLDYEIRCLEVYGNRLMIGAVNTANYLEAGLFSWDGVSVSFEEMWRIREPYVNAMKVWKNLLVIFCGEGNIYLFNGAILTKLPKKIPFFPDFTTSTFVRPESIGELRGNLIFGFGLSVFNYGGIYTLEEKEGFPLTIPYILSQGQIGSEPFSILNLGTDKFYVGWKKGTSYGIDGINENVKIVSSAIWESQIYEIAPASNPIPVKGIELIAKPMAAGTSTTIKYKLDNATSWSTAGTISSANQSKILWKLIGLAKTIQIRLEFTCYLNNSPEIMAIRIY